MGASSQAFCCVDFRTDSAIEKAVVCEVISSVEICCALFYLGCITLAGESVQNADLVNWVMVGLQHVPRAEDVPLIYNMYVNFFLKVMPLQVMLLTYVVLHAWCTDFHDWHNQGR